VRDEIEAGLETMLRLSKTKKETGMELTNIKLWCSASGQLARRLGVLVLMIGILLGRWIQRADAAVTTTTVQGTVYLANGVPGSGMLHLSWPSFTEANGQAIVADSIDVTIGEDGFFSVNLAPNQGAMPAGLYYTAVYYMSDGSVSTQYWVVPAAAQATLAQVQAQVMPAAQAVQTISKAYVDDAIAQISQSLLTGSGGSLTGPLYLSGDPTQPLQAADKHYVDMVVGQAGSNIVSPGNPGQVAVYAANGTSINGMNAVPVSSGGTGAMTADAALKALGGISSAVSSPQTLAGPLNLSLPYDGNTSNLNQAATAANVQNVAPRSVKEWGAKGDGKFSSFKMTAGSHTVQLVDVQSGFTFAPGDVGKLISLPRVDTGNTVLYTSITGYTDSTHVTVAAAAVNSFDGTGTGVNQAVWTTDDGAAINAALSAVRNSLPPGQYTRAGGTALFFPCGYYGTSQLIGIPGGVNVYGQNPGCATIMYMGTSTVDAAVEVYPPPAGGWLKNGFFMNPDFNNHKEINPSGCASGTGCSPSMPPGSVTGLLHDLSIFGNKYSYWALSVMFPANYAVNNLILYGGQTGCLYHINDVQVTYANVFCGNENIFGHGSPGNCYYADGAAPGSGPVPFKMQSPWATGCTATAMAFNYVGGATISDPQISVSHQSLNILPTSGGIVFEDAVIEAGSVADVVDGSGNVFIGAGFSGTGGVTVSGQNNEFISGSISGAQQLTISGPNNHFYEVAIPRAVTVTDTAKTTKFTGVYDPASGPRYNFPSSQEAVMPMGGTDPVVRASGYWYMGGANIPIPIATTSMQEGSAWKALFIGNWYYYAVATSMPDVLELTDTQNTVTVSGKTMTFSISSGGVFSVQSNTADNFLGFSGFIYILPRTVSAGSGGTNAMQLAGNVQAPSVQVGSGVAMSSNQGNGAKVQHSVGSVTADHCAKFDANGNVIDAGAMCSSGSGTGYAFVISQTVNGANTSTISFTGIPATARDLEMDCTGAAASTGYTESNLIVTLNSDTGAHYLNTGFYAYLDTTGQISEVTASNTLVNELGAGYLPDFNTGKTGSTHLLFPLYSSTVFTDKTLMGSSVSPYLGAPFQNHVSGEWIPQSAQAITRVDIAVGYGHFQEGTVCTMRGLP
jgi:hypothetical protein